MGIRNILRDGDRSLLKKSRVVTDFNKRLHVLLDDMRETLIDANGLGLAAPQVGVLRRAVLVVDTNIEDEDDEKDEEDKEERQPDKRFIELINPEITASSGQQTGNEGCLSIPGLYGVVSRPELVKVKAQDRHGAEFELWCNDLMARAVCHEIDHLNGVLFTSIAESTLTEEEMDRLNAEENEE